MRTIAAALIAPVLIVTALATGACPKDTAAPGATPSTSTAPKVAGPTGDVLAAYEGARLKLAGDDLPGALGYADKLATAAQEAARADASTPAFADIAVAAAKMKGADMAAARLAFGEVSKALIGVLVARPELQVGRHLMLCPMAKGYQKWVQESPQLLNPYWGKEMLECGEELKAWSI